MEKIMFALVVTIALLPGNTCTNAPTPSAPDRRLPPAASACEIPTCASPPCAANLVGDVGCTTVSGTEKYNNEQKSVGGTVATNAHIFGPFEAGFSSSQQSIIEGWGCTDASVAYDTAGGLDLGIATAKVAKACNIVLPRVEGTNQWKAIVGYCGGHTSDYHFHRDFACLYLEQGGHSTAVGTIVGTQKIYGKWEDFDNRLLPLLDACGGHFGPTPDSPSTSVYHYHAQDRAPWTVGCLGPGAGNTLVSVATCRALYTSTSKGCGVTPETMQIKSGGGTGSADLSVSYTRWCPCFDAEDKNVLPIVELPALSTTSISYTATIVAGNFGGLASAGISSSVPVAGTTSSSSGTTSSGSASSAHSALVGQQAKFGVLFVAMIFAITVGLPASP